MCCVVMPLLLSRLC